MSIGPGHKWIMVLFTNISWTAVAIIICIISTAEIVVPVVEMFECFGALLYGIQNKGFCHNGKLLLQGL